MRSLKHVRDAQDKRLSGPPREEGWRVQKGEIPGSFRVSSDRVRLFVVGGTMFSVIAYHDQVTSQLFSTGAYNLTASTMDSLQRTHYTQHSCPTTLNCSHGADFRKRTMTIGY